MIQKYCKWHDTEYFQVRDIEPYPHRYKVVTLAGIIDRLIPTNGLEIVDKILWSAFDTPDTITKIPVRVLTHIPLTRKNRD